MSQLSPRWHARLTAMSIAATSGLFAGLVWSRRWISDDGLIVVRVVRQILAGNGPVFNAHERVEASTSVLWTWLLAAAGALTGRSVTRLAVELGALCAVLAVVVAMDTARRWHRARGSTAALAPAAILVPLALPPFWDFATSGLEIGLAMLWLAVIWRLLLALDGETRPARLRLTALVLGLGPLVRPELALVSAVFVVAAWALVRPSRRRAASLAAIALALPVAYEVFRAGYYGVLVPLPALAKSAASAMWLRGGAYLVDFVWPYHVWVPALALATLVAVVRRRRGLPRRDVIVLAAPVVGAGLLALYIVRVGGDFMHARLLLPATWLFLLPGAMLPVRRATAPFLGVLASWALVIGVWRGDGRSHSVMPRIGDERVATVRHTGRAHPVDDADFLHASPRTADVAAAVARGERRWMTEWGEQAPLHPGHDAAVAYAVGRLGTGGLATPLDGITADMLGLANPIGARIPRRRGPAGHEKVLPMAWLWADYAEPAAAAASDLAPAVGAARRAMACGELAELLASVRAPMTPRRFWDNLVGSVRRTRLAIPSDPVEAERRFCGGDAQAAPAPPPGSSSTGAAGVPRMTRATPPSR